MPARGAAGDGHSSETKGKPMLNWAITFFLIAIVAAVLGFGGLAGDFAMLARICFFVFLIIAVASFIFGRRVI
jgi:uncharacterized membrane protein YtjA (UPF0391 family)